MSFGAMLLPQHAQCVCLWNPNPFITAEGQSILMASGHSALRIDEAQASSRLGWQRPLPCQLGLLSVASVDGGVLVVLSDVWCGGKPGPDPWLLCFHPRATEFPYCLQQVQIPLEEDEACE